MERRKFWFERIIRNNEKIYGTYGRKVSWIVKWFGKYGRKVSWIVERFGKYGRKEIWIVKKYGNGMENLEEKYVE
jgi:hypothetical protein